MRTGRDIDWRSVFPPAGYQRDGEWRAICPAHDDHEPSLTVKLLDDRVLLSCCGGKGCEVGAICKAAGIEVRELFFNPLAAARSSLNIVATYSYCDERGAELYQVVRLDPKDFRIRRRVGDRWDWKVKSAFEAGEIRRVPYRLPELVRERTRTICVVEGEKAADAGAKIGLLTTCSNGGAEKWPLEFGHYLAGRRVVIFPDNDEPGRRHAAQVAGSAFYHGAASVRIVRLPVGPKGDLFDWIEAGGNRDRLAAVVRLDKAPLYVLK